MNVLVILDRVSGSLGSISGEIGEMGSLPGDKAGDTLDRQPTRHMV